jgi:selenocysteine-specific elongation factor
VAVPRHFIVATAGHVDHGKSALIRALTGTDPDRLPEEKARGITIDLGFAQLTLGASSPSPLHLGIVDVPGHEDFVKNMVAGVGAVDLALLVVAADDGWMPQTEEHLQILSYVGVTQAVVAMTKADLVQDEARAVREIRARLRETGFDDAPIVPTSVVTGFGLDRLTAALADQLSTAPPSRDIGKPRLAVDRVFAIAGAGTVVTGTLIGGRLDRGQEVAIQPGGRTARVRRLQSHNQDVDYCGPGTRTAINLADLGSGGVRRGDVITVPALGGPSTSLDVMLSVSARATRSVKDGARVRIHQGSGNVPAHVALASNEGLRPGTAVLAQLRLETPMLVLAGDRFTLRDWSEQLTLAGGVVLDPEAARKGFRRPERLAWLTRLSDALQDPARFVAAHVAHGVALRRSVAFVKAPFGSDEIDAAARRLSDEGSVVLLGDLLVDASSLAETERRAAELVDEVHRTHPERPGLPLTDLRNALARESAHEALADAAIEALCQHGFARSGSVILRATHRAQLPEALRAAGDRLRQSLAARPLEPPSRKELAPDAASQRALKFLIENGEVVEVGAELVMSAASLAQAVERVRVFLSGHGRGTVSDLRQLLGSSRRVVVPLLEYLDRTFVTVRHGDTRTLR